MYNDRPPSRILSTGLALAVLLFLVAVYLAVQPPALGLSLAPVGDQVVVSRLGKAAPQGVQLGDRVLVVRAGALALELEPGDLLAEPDDVALYVDYNRFFARQAVLWQMQQASSLQLLVSAYPFTDAEWVEVRLLGARALTDLPFNFWYQVACGVYHA
ncbi:MAG: hypothetical protein M1440_03300 [Gammaproteobacteria bacterium]|nr:hypothetical protein [Gammaproteobacteria bacterium]